MSTTPLDIRAVLAVQALLSKIDGTGKFHFNIGENNFIGRGALNAKERPGASTSFARDTPTNLDDESQVARPPSFNKSVELWVDLFVPKGADSGINALWIKADCERAVQVKDAQLIDADGLIGGIEYRGGESVAVEEGGDVEGMRVTLFVDFTQRWGDPTMSE